MSEQSLIEKQPSNRALIRMFGRETRKIARGYTSQHIATLSQNKNVPQRSLNVPKRSAKTRAFRNKNNVIESLESSAPLADSSGRFAESNIGPPAYRD
jgi:hypothetical protein